MLVARTIVRTHRDRLGEGLLWSARENAVFWVDILGRRINRVSLADDTTSSWEVPETIGWIIERESAPGFIAGIGRRFARISLDPLTIIPIADPEPERGGNRCNDAKADAAGRIWAGTMPSDGIAPSGAFYRLNPDHAVTRVDDGYRIANGPAISGDGRSLFHTDTALGAIFRFAINDDGSLAPRTPHILFDPEWGSPDGMTLDIDGCLWVACWGGSRVMRFTPDGVPDRTIVLPATQITNVCFAGASLDRMFVTSASDGVDEPEAGALFEIDPGCQGLPTLRFGG